MKKRLSLLLVVLLAIGITALLLSRHAGRNNAEDNSQTSNRVQIQIQGGENLVSTDSPKPQLVTNAARRETLQGFAERFRNSLIRPIQFYGKVIDENGVPVSEATVVFSWTTDDENGVPPRHVQTGEDGLFSISGIQGKALDVRVSKNGYYSVTRSNRIAFEYAEQSNPKFHRPNQSAPVVYFLRKRGVGSQLLTSDKGMQSDFGITVPDDGTPVRVDLLTRTVSASGHIEVRTQKEPKDIRTGRSNWSLRLSVLGGGLIEHDQEFPFEAPESGYRPEMEWNFAKDGTNWVAIFKKEFFIKFGTKPYFGRMRVRTSAFDTAMFIEYAVNPNGSRNLEFAE